MATGEEAKAAAGFTETLKKVRTFHFEWRADECTSGLEHAPQRCLFPPPPTAATAVGADGINRFARPLCFQNRSNELLPEELKNENPLGLWRTVNNGLTKDAVAAE